MEVVVALAVTVMVTMAVAVTATVTAVVSVASEAVSVEGWEVGTSVALRVLQSAALHAPLVLTLCATVTVGVVVVE